MTQPQRIALAGIFIVGRLAAGALLLIAGVEAVHFAAMWWESLGDKKPQNVAVKHQSSGEKAA